MPSYTNVPRTSSSSVLQGSSIAQYRPRPYASGPAGHANGVMPLTDKEREARRQQKMQKKASFAVNNVGSANTMLSGTSSFFSPQLSTDFLQLPQSAREQRELYRHFYNNDPLVGQAIDLHTELPMSKVRLAAPRPLHAPKGFKDAHSYGKYILSFFMKMCERVRLFRKLIDAVHHYWLDGNVFMFAEDSTVDVPEDIGYEHKKTARAKITEDGEAVEEIEETVEELPNKDELEFAYWQKHYRGWERIVILPIDQIKLTTYGFTDKVKIEMIPSDRDRSLIEAAKAGDPTAQEMVEEMPTEVREHIEAGRLIPLGTDPDEGSFCYHLHARKGSVLDEFGASILQRCMRTLYYREKLRQAQTQIADRAMTPKRIVWGEGLSDIDTDDLREQVDLALVDPDYSIVTNYEVHWEEMGSRDRLLDLSSEYEQTDKQLFAGLGVTESLLNGEATFSGDRVKLEVLNTRYLLFREIIQEYVEDFLFKPIARRKGFIEKDEWGEDVVLYPRLSFTRLALRDSQDTYDALFNLYQKGSISIDVILDMFNIDPQDTREKIEKDMFTVNDSMFNEVIRGLYGEIGRELATKTDALQKIADYLKLHVAAAPEESGDPRF